MLIDGNGNRYGKEGTQNIPVADAFLSLLTKESDKGCGLKSFCLESKLECYDKNLCTHFPWRQCDGNEFCPITVYFKGYGLDKKQYKWRESRLGDRRTLELNEAQSIIDNNPVLSMSPGDLRREEQSLEEYLMAFTNKEQAFYKDYYEDEI